MDEADESRPAADRAESARRARSNYLLYLVATGVWIVVSILPGDPSDAADWVLPVVGSLSLLAFIMLVIGVVRAYGDRKNADEGTAAHFRLQIRSFWISWLYTGINILVFMVSAAISPWPGLLYFASEIITYAINVWFIIRCVKGLRYLSRQEPYPNPGTWLW